MTAVPGQFSEPAHVPTPETRHTAKVASGKGLPHDLVAKLVGINSKETLYKYYRHELDLGMAERGDKVLTLMHEKIDNGDSAMIAFYCKTQLGWRETKEEENKQPFNIYVNGKEVNL